MKRSLSSCESEEKYVNSEQSLNDINPSFISECEEEFNEEPSNVIARNAVVAIGSMISTTNSNRLNEIDHVFMNTIKKKKPKSY